MNYPIFGRAPGELPRVQNERPKHRDKELNHHWQKLAVSYLRKNPFCMECQRREGIDRPADCVDHIIPRAQRGPLFDRWNLQSLCNSCHNGVKRDLERLAVEEGDVRLLLSWMAKPETRPGRYAYVAIPVEE